MANANAAGPSADGPAERDPLALYRLLESFPRLASYRAKLFAVVLAGSAVPALLLVMVLVLGAGRLPLVAFVFVALALAGAGAAFSVWGVGRLLAPLDLATDAIDAVALRQPLPRVELPGSDTAAQVLRGVQALVGRVEAQEAEAQKAAERDPLTGLYNRRSGRAQAQAMIDRDIHRGRTVRATLADVSGFAAFNARFGAGHGDALLRAIASRLERVAGDEGVAVRWDGDAFLLLQSGMPDDLPSAEALLARPIVVKGSEDPVRLSFGVAQSAERISIDALAGQAEASLRAQVRSA